MDSLSISLPQECLPSSPPRWFSGPSTTRDGRGKRWVYNPGVGTSSTSYYAPRYTITEYPAPGGRAMYGTISFSAPKLIYGNSVEEVRETGLPDVLQLVTESALTAGFPVTTDLLANASVSSMEIARNIILPPFATCTSVTFPIGQAYYSTKTDLESIEYPRGGVGVKLHATGHEVAFYDKTEEARRGRVTPNHVLDPDTRGQRFPDGAVIPENLLRYEVRYNTRDEIAARLSSIGWGASTLTLTTAFSETLWDRLLLSELDRLDARLLVGLDPDEMGRMFVEDSAERGKKGFPTRLGVIAFSTLLPVLGACRARQVLKDMGMRRNYFDRIRSETAAMRDRAGSRKSPVDIIREGIREQPRIRFQREGTPSMARGA